MAKAKWGKKHRCAACGTVFYDLTKDPIICPSCGAKNVPEKLLKSRKVGSSAPKKPVKVVVETKSKPEGDDLDADLESDEPDRSDDLGNDEDDIAEVVPAKTNEGDA